MWNRDISGTKHIRRVYAQDQLVLKLCTSFVSSTIIVSSMVRACVMCPATSQHSALVPPMITGVTSKVLGNISNSLGHELCKRAVKAEQSNLIAIMSRSGRRLAPCMSLHDSSRARSHTSPETAQHIPSDTTPPDISQTSGQHTTDSDFSKSWRAEASDDVVKSGNNRSFEHPVKYRSSVIQETSRPIKGNMDELTRELSDLTARGNWRRAIDTFEHALRDARFAQERSSRRALSKHEQHLDEALPVRRSSWNQALCALAMGNRGRDAFALLRRMRENQDTNSWPDTNSYSTVLEVCAENNLRRETISVLDMMASAGVWPRPRGLGLALKVCVKEGNVTHARRLVSGMIKARNYDERIREESNRGGDSETSEVDFIQWAYNCALGAAGKGADWEAAFEILEEMRANGIKRNSFAYGGALEACGRTGQPEKARALLSMMADAFKELSTEGREDEIAPLPLHVNGLLSALCHDERSHVAVALLKLMLKKGKIYDSHATSSSAAAASSKPPVSGSNASSRVKPALTMSVAEREAMPAVDPGTRVLREAVAEVCEEELWEWRLPLPRPDCVSFGTVIDGCSSKGAADEAIHLLSLMREEGIPAMDFLRQRPLRGSPDRSEVEASDHLQANRFNVYCVTSTINACGRANSPEKGLNILQQALDAEGAWCEDRLERARAEGGMDKPERLKGRQNFIPAFNSAIDAFVKCGKHDEAKILSAEMRRRGMTPGVNVLTSLMTTASCWEEASNILQDVGRAQGFPDAALLTAAISACSRGADLPAALALLDRMRAGPNPMVDEIAYGEAASACARARKDTTALDLLRQMREDGLKPGEVMYGAVMNACAKKGNWKDAISLLQEMEADGLTPGETHYSYAVFACAVGRRPEGGIAIIGRMKRKGIDLNARCFNAALHGFALLKDSNSAVRLLEGMEHAFGVAPDTVSYNTAMEACFKAGEPHRALELFEVMRAAHPTAALGTAAAATDKRDRKPPSGQAFKAGHEDGTTDEAMGSTTCRPPPPDLVTFNTALKGMSSWTGSSGREEIMAILRDMEVRALLERKSREASHEM